VGWRGRVHTTVLSIRVWWVVARLQGVVWHVHGVPTRVFGGGRHAFGCRHWRWWRCCIAAAGMGLTMTLLSLPSMARAVFLCACIISGRWWRRVPTWPLPACCLYLLFPSSFLFLPSLFPTPHPFLPFSLLWVRIEQVVGAVQAGRRGGCDAEDYEYME
jgi:hypothetical protein